MAPVADDVVVGRNPGRAGAEEFWGGFFGAGRVTSLDLRLDPLLIDGAMAIETGEYNETIVMVTTCR